MLYVSLPVHEKPEVIVDQMKNFARYLPDAKVVLHLSKGANFSINDLETLFQQENVQNGLINPIQVETRWGSIIQAHLENIRYIIKQGNAEKVIFHSSNDMLIMDGLSEYLKDKKNIFHLRKCTKDSLWWVARRAFRDSSLSSFFNDNIYASQIEGSMYDIHLLESLLCDIEHNKLNLETSIFYPREEIIFSSFVYKKCIIPDGIPYVFSEVNRFDNKFYQYLVKYRLDSQRESFIIKVMKMVVMQWLFIRYDFKLSVDDILAIRKRDYFYLKEMCYISDRVRYEILDINNIYAVKRVSRNISDKVRLFINNMK